MKTPKIIIIIIIVEDQFSTRSGPYVAMDPTGWTAPWIRLTPSTVRAMFRWEESSNATSGLPPKRLTHPTWLRHGSDTRGPILGVRDRLTYVCFLLRAWVGERDGRSPRGRGR